jgi:hypothetical protein
MKKVLFFITASAAFLLNENAAFAQTKNKLEGVWKIVEVILPVANPAGKDSTRRVSNPQPGLIIFTRGYYSVAVVRGAQPRAAVAPPKDSLNLTDDEKIARYTEWNTFVANSGTYEIKGSTLIRHPIVAKNVSVMTNNTPNISEFKLEGDNTLWLNPTPDRLTTDPRIKLTRLE